MKYIILPFLLLLIQCANPTSGGVENTPNFVNGKNNSTIAGSITNPFLNNKIILKQISLNDTGAAILKQDTTTLDGYGNFKFHEVAVGSYGIIVENNNETGIFSRINLTDSQAVTLKTIRTYTPISIKGRVLGTNCKVQIPGLESSTTTTDENGFYIIKDVPVGSYDINFISQYGTAYLSISTEKRSDTSFIQDIDLTPPVTYDDYSGYNSDIENKYITLPILYPIDSIPSWYTDINFNSTSYEIYTGKKYIPALNENGEKVIIIDDFEDEEEWSSYLDEMLTSSHWYSITDTSSMITKNIQQDSNSNSKFIDISSMYGTTMTYGILGLSMRSNIDGFVNLTNLTRVEFKAKGHTSIGFALESPIIDEEVSNYVEQPSFIIDLTDEWQTYTINVDSLKPSSGYGWDDIKHSISRMEFTISGPNIEDSLAYKFSIDDIKFYGTTINDLKKP